ncbi:MAG: hypothetical protein WDO56_09815 [Gammaproteobacteria bacterium]
MLSAVPNQQLPYSENIAIKIEGVEMKDGDGVDDQEHGIERRARSSSRPGALPLDVSKYREDIADFELTEEQRIVLLTTLWNIMRSFAEIGFGIDRLPTYIPELSASVLELDDDRPEGETKTERRQHPNTRHIK